MHTFTCKECQKKFQDYLSEKRQFCSKSCSAKSTGRGKQKTLGKHWKVKDTSKMKHNRFPFWAVGRKPSEETRKKLSEANRGEKSPYWKGGITKISKRIRRGVEYRLWREAVYKRDNFTCQICGIRGNYLHPHHIYRFSEHEERRFELNNGITLCRSCHKTITPTDGEWVSYFGFVLETNNYLTQ